MTDNVAKTDNDLVSKLTIYEKTVAEEGLRSVCPDDGKYRKKVDPVRKYLSAEAEWNACAYIQLILLDVRARFGQATAAQVMEVQDALQQISPLNMSLLEDKVTHHDQLAVVEEIGRFVSTETKALLHPGTTSYDILDTGRAYLLNEMWNKEFKPVVLNSIKDLSELAKIYMNTIQVGRTHLQDTTPVLFGGILAGYAARLADRTELCNQYFNNLRGKISGIVGTGASIDAVIGKDQSMDFELQVLRELGLKPDYTATQITQKERLADVGHGIVSLMCVLGDFANDMRMLYSSAIQEVTDRDAKERLGGSSADATKNNPIDWENIAGKVSVVKSGIIVLYDMISSDFQRDLRGSVQARYQPGMMISETFESFVRLNKSLKTLSVNADRMAANLIPVRNNPGDALVAILRGQGWIHNKYGLGHAFAKEMGKISKKTGRSLGEVCLEDAEFKALYKTLPELQQQIIIGKIENYLGSAHERAYKNLEQCNQLLIKEGVVKK